MRTKRNHIAHGIVNDGSDSFCCFLQVPIGEVAPRPMEGPISTPARESGNAA